jgi:acyl carrier protein
MNHQDVVAKLIELVTPIAEGRAVVINETTSITSELGLDSLKVMDLVVAVEDEFDFSVPINELAEVRTVGDFASLIQKHAGERA